MNRFHCVPWGGSIGKNKYNEGTQSVDELSLLLLHLLMPYCPVGLPTFFLESHHLITLFGFYFQLVNNTILSYLFPDFGLLRG